MGNILVPKNPRRTRCQQAASHSWEGRAISNRIIILNMGVRKDSDVGALYAKARKDSRPARPHKT